MPSWGPDLVNKLISISFSIKASTLLLKTKTRYFSVNQVQGWIFSLIVNQFEVSLYPREAYTSYISTYKEFNLQKYSDFNLPKSLVKNLTKLKGSVIHRAIGSKQLLR
jgi:hypothetical protein